MTRTTIYMVSLLSSLIFTFCSLPKKFASGNENLAKKTGGEFVQLNQGKIVQTSKIISSFTSKREIKTNEGLVLSWDEVKAFQTKDAYFGATQPSWSKKRIFIPRVIKGNINVYRSAGTYATLTGATGRPVSSSDYYIQKGNDGEVVKLTAGALKAMIKDYEPAYSIVAALGDKADNNKKLEDAILAYNLKP